MKNILKHIVLFIIRLEMKAVLLRYKPEIIGVTGSVGKTSAKDAIYCVLKNSVKIRKSPKSYNSEIGIPLAVLGLNSAYNSFLGWVANIIKGVLKAVSFGPYPESLVLEMGVQRPNDIDALLKTIKPSISVVTAIGEVPVHVEYFDGPVSLAKEKSKILTLLHEDEYAVLNSDDEIVYKMREKTRARVITYGFGKNAEAKALNYKILIRKVKGEAIPDGITFKISYEGNVVPIRLSGILGEQYVYSALAAAVVGIIKGLNLVDISEALSAFEPPPGRMRVIKGIKKSYIIDDTYNSSPIAARAAIELLKKIPSVRRIAVLGDMLELGKFTVHEHKELGALSSSFDILITVGSRAKYIKEGAIDNGMSSEKIISFQNSEEAGAKIMELIEEGDVVLVKGSQGVRMERIVEKIMLEPHRAKELLARQDKFWKKSGLSPLREIFLRIIGAMLILVALPALFFSPIPSLILLVVGIILIAKTR